MRSKNKSIALGCLLATTALASPAAAQSAPEFRTLDQNGVDLVRGDLVNEFVEGSVGSGEAELTLKRILGAAGNFGTPGTSQWDHILLRGGGVELGATSIYFPGAFERGYSTSGTHGNQQFTMPDGTVIAFVNNEPPNGALTSNLCRDSPITSCIQYPSAITAPDGKSVAITYDWWSQCSATACTFTPRIASVTNNFGYSVHFSYATPGSYGTSPPPASFHQRTGATFKNGATTVSLTGYVYPATGVADITDTGGRQWRITNTSAVTAIRRPGSISDDVVYNKTYFGEVTSVVRDGITTQYNRAFVYPPGSPTRVIMTVTNALNQSTVIETDSVIGRPSTVTDALNRTTTYEYDEANRLMGVGPPESNWTSYYYDERGNIWATTESTKPAGPYSYSETSATYDLECFNQKTCNQPNTTTDARDNVTNYTYDPNHGDVTSVTLPAATPGGVRPQTRFSYTPVSGVQLRTVVSACRTLASCSGTAEEVKTAWSYDLRGNLESVSAGAGDNSLTATNAMTYDAIGNLLTLDGPLPGAADTTRYRYNANRERIGVVGPDPDGAGPLKHRATRITYAPTGLASKVEQGTVNSQSDADWAAFVPLQEIQQEYDGNRRPTVRRLVAGGTTFALTQTSYDPLGRPDCVATRMNPAAFASLPASACTLGTQGSFGPDRIARTTYDAVGRVAQTQVALGTADQSTEATATYTPNGRLETLTDTDNNRTTYEYDGFDRLAKTRMPDVTKGSGTSSTTDYEQLTYDAASNVTVRRLRDGQTIGFTYDNLDRPTFKNLPGAEPDVSYGYDLLGRLTSASQPGHALGFTYDALGRSLTETGPLGSVWHQWDLAGRRVRVDTSSGYSLMYQRLVTGEMSAMFNGLGHPMANWTYDDLGRRIGMTRVYGSSDSSWSYDGASRLTGLTHDFAGTANDVSWSFGYNPAGQFVTRAGTNDTYAWTGHGSGTTASYADGLNRLVITAGAWLGYDGRANIEFDPTTGKSFTYSSENRLTTASGGVVLGYDPLGRLYQLTQSANVRRFLYAPGESGIPEAVSEYDGSGALTHNHAYGPGVDEPIMWWDGTQGFAFRQLHADERGSLVAITDGAVTSINRYDEYGKPAATNSGQFQYTGQMYLPEIGLYHYKNRAYAPHLGRFMQTDPIGYEGGMNLYAYVGSDPVNLTDPLGLQEIVATGPDVVVTGTRPASVNLYPDEYRELRPAVVDPGGKFSDGEALQNGCSPAGAAARARANAGASNLGPVTFDSASEMGLLTQYFRGDTTPYRLSGTEMAQARSYVGTYGQNVLGSNIISRADGLTERSVFFGKIPSSAPLLDGLLGTATGIFSGNNLVGLKDTFNFDFKDRGGYPYGTSANLGVALIRLDAASCAGNISIPVSGGVR